VGDLGQVVLVEQGHPQRPVVGGQLGYGRGAEAGQPAQVALVA
jgi:hypothetical protein